ncbi:MAG TPA: transglutaminase-like domain-containing protein [Gemmatimonadaceae bacterium]|nr:transglutaminase-like domain-containing protein [Gemmatimonadaceae bacterium]
MNRRALTAVAIVVAWLGGLGMLVRREYFRPHIDRLAEAALRVQPAAVFYAVMQGDHQVGFASSTVDTSTAVIEQREYFVADIPVGGRTERTTSRTTVTLTRTLRVRTFDVETERGQRATRLQGEVSGDTALTLVTGTGASADTQRIALSGPILLTAQAPLAVALEEKPSIGRTYVLPLFDPGARETRDVRIDVRAESLFVVNDSSVFDSTSGRWQGVLADTVRAWQIVSQGGSGIGGWVDQQGRLLATTQMGFRLERRPYEVAFENWRRDLNAAVPVDTGATRGNGAMVRTTALAAGKRPSGSARELRVRISGASLDGFDMNGGRQRWSGDTLIITREDAAALSPRYIANDISTRQDIRAEPFLEVNHPEIRGLAQRVTNNSRDPRLIAQRLNKWVHDSVQKEAMLGIPSALHVLHTRRGDAGEHAQLFVALARAVGVPARVVTGLLYIDGRFYYHAWPEVRLRAWVAVDPTFGQFPADAAHLRFVSGGLERQDELTRLPGSLSIDVLPSR